ncbi:PEP-CTERM protein-sorting domain-containing protein [Nitrosomonas sp. Nm51]|uniref:PEP-CTERM sorting domain-containing protein n=1 Tax=Nitrosomonas sp. Nm51 TaxID=133720 RepID=UPI0008C1490B|nr:PEP-CTERM sorting domain-containing protein [Nitrosomonas sp. Nm51]SER37966.1 PEP-CTERM protein-sorting domain-containing protein [Nitrosomonas sp. Nm51]
MTRILQIVITITLIGCLLVPHAHAINTGTYVLHNHPDGGIAPPLYGLRLDGLLGDPAKEYTFDFDHSNSNMLLTWNGSRIVIDGVAYGGEDTGSGYKVGTTALWNIHFEYDTGVSQTANGGLSDLIVNSDNANFGTISSGFGAWELEDQSNNAGLAFQLGDENGSGHRGFAGISGWGWMNHGANCIAGDCNHIYASDWLFTADPARIPLPSTIGLLGTGLLGLMLHRRQKKLP